MSSTAALWPICSAIDWFCLSCHGPPRAATGSIYHVGVRGEDIALSRQPLYGVSIQNQIKGRVCAVIPRSDRALVQIDVGLVLLAEITQRTVASMRLREGDQVYCLIKTQAFQFLAGDMVCDASDSALKLVHTLGAPALKSETESSESHVPPSVSAKRSNASGDGF